MTAASRLPMSYEIAVETTFPAGPTKSAGLLWIFAQAWAFVFTLIMSGLSTSKFPTNWNNVTNNCDNNNIQEESFYYKKPLIVLAAITSVAIWIWLVFMRCDFKRRYSQ